VPKASENVNRIYICLAKNHPVTTIENINYQTSSRPTFAKAHGGIRHTIADEQLRRCIVKGGFVRTQQRVFGGIVGVPSAPVSGVPQVGDIGRVYMGLASEKSAALRTGTLVNQNVGGMGILYKLP